ncbi:hypothetical protein ABZW47_29365 [Streptomyces sp. NPDC004549]|uniref:hypothetical protein n=1 Tax=Streptomyces sp. NPDC004549 TaxID=3154283 RepID=UPI0033A4CF56
MRLTPVASPLPPLFPPDWVPPSGGLRTWPVGQYFDAVRIPESIGPPLARALAKMGALGPVLAHPYSGSWHLLTEPGAMSSGPWAGAGIRLLRSGTRLTVPAADVTRGRDVHWHVPPGGGRTTASQLSDVLCAATRVTVTRRGVRR